jgi:hypothetical protein
MSRFFPAPEVPMSRVQKEPLRRLCPEERSHLERVSRAFGLPAALIARAKVLLAVADGHTYIDAVAALVSLFNHQWLAALEPRHAGGPAILYDTPAKERILREFHRQPDRERDGTATWSLTTLQRALHRARRWPALRQHVYDLVRFARVGSELAARSELVSDRRGCATP